MSKFDQIAGYAGEKKELMDICKLIKKYDEFSGRGFRLPRGILLCGEPGVGKTVLAEALIEETGVFCQKIDFNAVDDDNVSEYLDAKFKEAKQNVPAIVFMDELDKFVGNPGFGIRNTYDMDSARKILKAMDDNARKDIMVVATINNVDMLCPALTRSGRFDKIITIPLPELEDRKNIIRLYCEGKAIDKKVNVNNIAKITAGFSGADIECLINEAGLSSVVAERNCITQEDIEDAINKIVFKSSKKIKPLDKQDRDIVAVHEAGHLVACLLLNSDSVGGASILPQGKAGGHVKIAQCNRGVREKGKVLDQVVIALSGKAAEKVFFEKEDYLGATSDIEHAYEMVRRLVTGGCGYGFEYYFKADDSPFSNVILSEKKLQMIENKCDAVLLDCLERASVLMSDNVDLINKYVAALKRNFTLSRDDIMRIYKRECAKKQLNVEIHNK